MIVSGGANTKFLPRLGEAGMQHTLPRVYREMFLQVCRNYTALPDPRTLKFSEIRFFYEGLRYELIERSKPK